MAKAADAGPASVRKRGARRTPVRKWMHDALRESDLARQCLDIAGVILLAIDADGNVSMINKKGCETLGWTEEEILGRNWIDSFLPEGLRNEVSVAFDRVMAGEIEPVEHFEHAVITRSGEERIIAWHNTVLRDDTGNVTGNLSSGEDVTALRATGEALRHEEQYFRSLIENSLDAIMVMNADGTVRYESPSTERMLGYGPGERTGQDAFDYVHADDMATAAQAFAELIANPGSIVRVEVRALHKNGSWRALEIVANNLIDNPAVGGIVANTRDITERKQAEGALQDSEARYRLLAENVSDVITATDRNGRPTYMSPSYEVLTGFTPEEAMSRTMEESLTPESLKAAAEALSVAMPGDASGGRHDPRKSVLELELYRKDGSTVWVEARINLISGSNGQPTGLVSVLRDITERRMVENALRRNEEHFRALVENSSDAIMVLNADGTVRYESPSTERMLGYAPGERIGQDAFGYVHADDMAAAAQAFAELIANPGSIVRVEVRALHKDGSWRALEIVASNLIGNTAVAGIVVNMRDITERKQAEEALRESELSYSLLVGNLADAVFRYKDGAIVWGNDRIREMLGYEEGEIIGEDVNLFVPDDVDLAALLEQVEVQLEERGYFTGATRARRKDGGTIEIEYTAAQIPGKDPLELVGVARDVTERKRDEEALAESEEKYRSLISSIPEVTWTTDEEGNTTFISPNVEQIYGYTSEELCSGGDSLWIGRIHPDDVKSVRSGYAELFEKRTPFDAEYRIKRKDGEWVWIHDRAITTYMKDGTAHAVGVFSDITERKRAEELVRESEEKYRELINTSADGMISVDADMKVVLWNRRAQDIFGYSEEEILGQSLYKIIPQRYRKAKRKGVRLYAGTGTGPLLGKTAEIEGLRKDGTEVPVELSMSSRKVGDAYVATAIVRDITERRRADEELRARTHALGERVKEQTCLNGVLKKAGEPGISLEEVFERTLELIPPGWQYPEITCARITFAGRVLTTDNFAETSWLQTSDIVTQGERTGSVEVCYGEEMPELDEGPFLQEERNLLDAVARLLGRIAERIQTEEALEESERKLRQIFGSVNDEIIFTDPSGVIIDVNEGSRAISGYAPDEVIGHSIFDLDLFDRDELARITELMGVSAREGSPALPLVEMRVKHRDGHRVSVEVNTSIMSGADGSLAGFVSVIRDITERKKAEEEREGLVAELAEKNKELEHIVYVSSHDLRSPLVNVQGFSKELNYSLQELVSILQHEEISQEVREKLSPIIETDIADSLTYIQASVLKMDSLLSGLLRLSRLGRAALTVETLNLDEMVSEVMKANEYRIKSARVTVEIGDLPPCKGDSVQINQVFSNLVDNALKYLDPARPGTIRVTGSVNGDSSVYCVEDNGVGIAEKDLEQVFVIFQQLNPRASTGDGIGLAVARKIMGRNNGRIWVESEPGVGSKFFVSLPTANDYEPEGEGQ